jgi:predicted NBD/HSP70 family sugar kinase
VRTLGVDIGGTTIKTALFDDGSRVGAWRSDPYERPDRAALIRSLRACTSKAWEVGVDCIGICCPGAANPSTGVIDRCVNVPGLQGLSPGMLLDEAADRPTGCVPIQFTDAFAAAADIYISSQFAGRLLGISLGTGVGAALVDHGCVQLLLHGVSSGHLGQIDVSFGPDAPVGPDGGRGSLEAYIGWPALKRRSGPSVPSATIVSTLRADDEPVLALVRAIRIAHAIYKPDHVCLLGGIGIGLSPLSSELYAAVSKELTCVAKPGWTLGFGNDAYHAASGAARLAERSVRSAPSQTAH